MLPLHVRIPDHGKRIQIIRALVVLAVRKPATLSLEPVKPGSFTPSWQDPAPRR